jgi:hypothetical protein
MDIPVPTSAIATLRDSFLLAGVNGSIRIVVSPKDYRNFQRYLGRSAAPDDGFMWDGVIVVPDATVPPSVLSPETAALLVSVG